MATLFRLIRVVVVLCALVSLGACSKLFFYPMKPWVQNPARIGLAYEDVILIHPDGLRLHGWWLPAAGPAKGTVYFLHGNAQNVSTHVMSVAWLPDAGYNVFLPDYRGYGLSQGKPRLPDVFDDIQLGLDWLGRSGRANGKPLIVFGQSLGAVMGIEVLARDGNQEKVACTVFEAPFTGYRGITNDVMKQSWLLWPLRPLVVPLMPSEKWDPAVRIGELRMPKLILHSREDEIIPFAHGEAVYDQAAAPKEFQPLLGRHIEAMRDPSVQKRVQDFFESRCGVEAAKEEPESGLPSATVPGAALPALQPPRALTF